MPLVLLILMWIKVLKPGFFEVLSARRNARRNNAASKNSDLSPNQSVLDLFPVSSADQGQRIRFEQWTDHISSTPKGAGWLGAVFATIVCGTLITLGVVMLLHPQANGFGKVVGFFCFASCCDPCESLG